MKDDENDGPLAPLLDGYESNNDSVNYGTVRNDEAIRNKKEIHAEMMEPSVQRV